MTIDELEEALTDLIPGFAIDTDNNGQLIIYTGLTQDEDGELVDFESDEDEESDPDFEPLQDDDLDDE